ncbi:hypothetical protein CFOL_v3_34536 [Cephalotus follicularis]|uniref:Uncharacterized protein n=1 Tax=Cephalotus follicularis TaxID=3775 RepID=A0A1Q3DF79_CEPFO|nr:hypothetical protein CFOL_v3_23640 [Cephalotus follicularis]GAV91137.1 hypothetical protein CFOL_v3_34536 [Cephalotus follicularis]
MNPRRNELSRGQRSRNYQGEGPNWMLIAGGALLSTLSIRLGYKLKQALDTRQQTNASNDYKVNGLPDRRRSPGSRLHSNMYSFPHDDDGRFNCISGNEGVMEGKHPPNGQMQSESDVALPLVAVADPEFNKENGVLWESSPDRLELPPKPFHHSNCSDSPCVSESGSDIFSKREVIQKLRQQLKRRDDMILEMQDQIMELQNSLNSHLAHSTHMQSQLDAANRDLFDSEREIQRLRKAIADHCVKPPTVPIWLSDARNGHANGYIDGENNYESTEKGRGDGDRIDMLKREVGELKELIEGKEYLLQSYKEQKSELSMKIKELQHRLDSQVPNIL